MTSSVSNQQNQFVIGALDKYERPLTRYAMGLLGGDLAAARDVVQHAFLKLCEQDRQSMSDRLAPWLYTVCRNRAIDELRGRKGEEQLDDDWFFRNGRDTALDPASIVADGEFFEKLLALIDQLPASQREIVELWSQGLCSTEMSEITGKQSGAIRIALHRAIKHLKEHESVRRWLGEVNELPVVARRT